MVVALAVTSSASTLSATITRTPRLAARASAAGATTRAIPRGIGVHGVAPQLEPLVLAAIGDSMVTLALTQLGMPYVLGGTTPRRGFDCSGLVRWVYLQMHMTLPRTADRQALTGVAVPRDALRPGDLLAFGDGKRVSHIGIYVGHGKFVHASSVAGRVVVSPLDRQPSRLIRPMQGARRLLASIN